jgi:hypothetical protein
MREQCSRIEELLIASTLHEISKTDREVLEAHLADCPDCRQYHQVLHEDDRRLTAYVKATEPVMHSLEDRVLNSVSEQLPEKEDRFTGRRFWARQGWIRYAAAAAAVLVVVSYLLFDLKGTSGVAWADVIDRVIEARDYICRMEKRGNFGTDLDMVQYCSGTFGIRQDLYVDDTKVAAVFINPEERRVVSLIHKERKYAIMELSEEDFEKALSGSSPQSFVERLRGDSYREIGSQTIDGVTATGIETDSSEIAGGLFEEQNLRLWVDEATQWPVRMEFEGKANDGEIWSKTTMFDFTWNPTLTAGDFAYEIPDDYTNIGTLQRAETNEASALEGLRWFGKVMNGRYPSQLIFASIVKEFEAEEPRLRREGVFGDKDMMNFLSVQRSCRFLAELERQGKDPVYYGKNIRSNDFDKVLLRWRDDEDSYRVVFGDLRVETVSMEELKGLEEGS